MKTLIKYFLITSCLLFSNSNVYLQLKFEEKDNINFIKQKSDLQEIKKMINDIIINFGKSFKYYNELKKGCYEITGNKKNGYNLKIFEINSKRVLDVIKIKKNNLSYSLYNFSIDKIKFSSLLDETILKNDNMNKFAPKFDVLYVTNNILKDQEILNTDDFDAGKVLSREICLEHFFNSVTYEPAPIFKDLQGGIFLPKNDQSGRVILTDKTFCSYVYADLEYLETERVRYYGQYGRYRNEFCVLTGITTGRFDENTINYSIYFADMGNSRIVKIIYKLEGTNFGFDTSTYQIVIDNYTTTDKIHSPYDIAYFKSTSESNDKIWVSEQYGPSASLVLIDLDGNIVQKVIGYQYTVNNINYNRYFEDGQYPRLSVFNEYFAALCFVDAKNNCVVGCLLNEYGEASLVAGEGGYLISAGDILSFPANIKPTSVSFHKASLSYYGWPYVWISSTPVSSSDTTYIHCTKMNSNAHFQYLGSASKPRNTDQAFYHLNNIMTQNLCMDIYTIEEWVGNYGIRKYQPYADFHSDILYNYCSDSLNYMRWVVVLTNDCLIEFTADRLNKQSGWDKVKIKEINGEVFNNTRAVIERPAGNSEASVDIMNKIVLDLPFEDYIFGGRVKLHVKVQPEYGDPNDFSECISKDYEVDIQKTCLPKPGGCPYVYVRSEEDSSYKPDNNILHKYEYFGSSMMNDLNDKYVLKVRPAVIINKVYFSILENELDVSQFDQFKLHIIDHPDSTVLGVTENNQFALFNINEVKNADYATLNYAQDITDRIVFNQNNNNPVKGYISDYLYADYNNTLSKNKNIVKAESINTKKNISDNDKDDNNSKVTFKNKREADKSLTVSDSIAIIADISNLDTLIPVNQKNWAGYMNIRTIFGNDITNKYFSRREKSSLMILPILPFDLTGEPDDIDSLNISWLSDFLLKYLCLAKVSYSIEPITLSPYSASQISRDSSLDILSTLLYDDDNYAEMDTSSFINMSFDLSLITPVSSGYTRDYVLETVGKYTQSSNKYQLNVDNQLPKIFQLYQNYPNPFNPKTIIKYDLPTNTKVTIKIYDILGREVQTLLNDELKSTGRYEIEWNAINYASGVYFYRIEAGSFVQAKKMILLK